MNQAVPDGGQQTIARAAALTGQGLHSGNDVEVRLLPAAPGTGIFFRRIDLPGQPVVAVSPANLESGNRCTTLSQGDTRVRTTEHLLAVCAALCIDNLEVELNAEELPILDGSAVEWLRLLKTAGLQAQSAPRVSLTVSAPLLYQEGDSVLMALPSDRLRVTVASITAHPVAGRQCVDVEITPRAFEERLASARTFCFWEEVEPLLAAGLARGGSLENALVVKQDGYSSPLRMPQELAAHKALDLLGDLAVLGGGLRFHVVAVCPGHRANQQLVKLIANQSNPEFLSLREGCRGPVEDPLCRQEIGRT